MSLKISVALAKESSRSRYSGGQSENCNQVGRYKVLRAASPRGRVELSSPKQPRGSRRTKCSIVLCCCFFIATVSICVGFACSARCVRQQRRCSDPAILARLSLQAPIASDRSVAAHDATRRCICVSLLCPHPLLWARSSDRPC